MARAHRVLVPIHGRVHGIVLDVLLHLGTVLPTVTTVEFAWVDRSEHALLNLDALIEKLLLLTIWPLTYCRRRNCLRHEA